MTVWNADPHSAGSCRNSTGKVREVSAPNEAPDLGAARASDSAVSALSGFDFSAYSPRLSPGLRVSASNRHLPCWVLPGYGAVAPASSPRPRVHHRADGHRSRPHHTAPEAAV